MTPHAGNSTVTSQKMNSTIVPTLPQNPITTSAETSPTQASSNSKLISLNLYYINSSIQKQFYLCQWVPPNFYLDITWTQAWEIKKKSGKFVNLGSLLVARPKQNSGLFHNCCRFLWLLISQRITQVQNSKHWLLDKCIQYIYEPLHSCTSRKKFNNF